MRIFLVILVMLTAITIKADDSLDDRINRLIRTIEISNCQFVRNGKTYTPEAGIAHIRKKYRHFKDDIDSVHKFIDLSASRSLMSGRPYLVQYGTSEPEFSSTWLAAKAMELGISK